MISQPGSAGPVGAKLGLAPLLEAYAVPFRMLDAFLRDQVSRFEVEVQPLVAYTLQHSGKKLRPLLVFMGGQGGRAPAQDLVKAAAIVELVHLATLVHDDILDQAELRHRSPTVAHRFGTHEAVLLGDALFAHALMLAADFPTTRVCAAVASATRDVCSGEIVQTFRRGDLLSRAAYDRIVRLKTGRLFAVSGFLGALLADYPEPVVGAIEGYCQHLGTAYQIYDDLVDLLADEDGAGKTLGTDLQTLKLTLPILLLLEARGPEQAVDLIEAMAGGQIGRAELAEAIRESGAAEETRRQLEHELAQGERLLAAVPAPEPAQQLPRLAHFLQEATHRLF